MEALETAIRAEREALEAASADDPKRPGLLSNLGVRLGARYSRTKSPSDLDEAIQVTREAILAAPIDHPNRLRYLGNLGNRLEERYKSSGDMNDLDEALQIAEDILEVTPSSSPNRILLLNNVGVRLGSKYDKLGTPNTIEDGIQQLREAVEICPSNHPDRAQILKNLANRYRARYLKTQTASYLEKAIILLKDGLKTLEPSDNSSRGTVLTYLVKLLRDRYLETPEDRYLDEAISISRVALDATPSGHQYTAGRLRSLAVLLGDRYQRQNRESDLEESVATMRRAVDVSDQNSPDHASILNSLGNTIWNRYRSHGLEADLNESIRLAQDALKAMPPEHPERVVLLNNFAIRLRARYEITKRRGDIEKAHGAINEALSIAALDHPSRGMLLSNLALVLGDKPRMGTRNVEDAVRIAREAVTAVPANHPDRGSVLQNLATALLEKGDSGESLSLAQEVVDATPSDHSALGGRLLVLATLYRGRYVETGARSDLELSLSSLHRVLSSSSSSVSNRILAGDLLVESYALDLDWCRAYEAAAAFMPLVPLVAPQLLENTDKQRMLRPIAGTASDAAAAALSAGKDAFTALEFLELGRGVLLSSVEDMRADVMDLENEYPKLAEDFTRLRDVLNSPSTDKVGDSPSGTPHDGQRHDAAKRLDGLLVEIRGKAGFEEFLCPPKRENMLEAAKYGPIVVINVSKYRCDALLLEHHQVRSLALPLLSKEDIVEKVQHSRFGYKVLEWLWDAVAGPVLDALGFYHPPSSDNWPRIWWIPTGLLSRFPLHAAGRHSKTSANAVVDRVASSYGTTLKSIILGRQRRVPIAVPGARGQGLLVAMQDTPGLPGLVFPNDEIKALRDIFKTMKLDPVEPLPRKQDILASLRDCKIFHFAGHGYSNNDDPLRSCLFLRDWKADPLTVAGLLEINLRECSPFLAYLSACETGQVKEQELVDETVHLISACQLAGFRHVIGTLWEVNDESCVLVSKTAYEGMREGGMTDESVCLGLHKAVKKLRDQCLKSPATVGRAAISAAADMKFEDGDQSNSRLPRDIGDSDEDSSPPSPMSATTASDSAMSSLHWVPFIHYGV